MKKIIVLIILVIVFIVFAIIFLVPKNEKEEISNNTEIINNDNYNHDEVVEKFMDYINYDIRLSWDMKYK